MATQAVPPSRSRAYVSTLFSLMLTGVLAWLAASHNEIDLYAAPHLRFKDYLIGAGTLVLLLTSFFYGLKKGKVSAATKWMAPQTNTELFLFLLVALAAAVAEESAYRGAAYQLFGRVFNSYLPAAIASAIAFGLAHRVQGLRAVAITILHGLLDQAVVYLTGTLYIMMGVHFLYNVAAGLILYRFIVTQPNQQ